ncbi:16747_t:CDS:2 [Funneliformis mosseae]|uniref:16747_t:CDS:1 n=1 Tax=Funneliformis mosseae TaxID=27381 RepID=A0A9N9BU06_FUNMO|nr:16747_t:CDS:2 [Funneliformis mosseae]
MALIAQQVQEILADNFLNLNTPEDLLYCRRIEGGAAQNIHLPPNSESANDIKKYLSKRPSGASKNFYLHINPLWRETGIYRTSIWFLTNHSGHKTVAQILQNANVSEDTIMGVTGHKSIQGIRVFKEVNKKQHLAAMDTYINAIEPSRSILTDSSIDYIFAANFSHISC